MLISECEKSAVNFSYQTEILSIEKLVSGEFLVKTSKADYQCQSLIIATGGLSMPKLGATPFAYKIAEQFGLRNITNKSLV